MTDDATETSQGEEPDKTEMRNLAGNELSPSMITPDETEEATQTMATETSINDLSTTAGASHAETTPVTPDNVSIPTVQASPLAAPRSAYEQFGMSNAVTQSAPYPDAQFQPANFAALSAQGAPVQYPAQPGQFYTGQPGAPVPVAKKRRTLLWVAIVVIAILLFGGSATLTYALTQPQAPAPDATLKTYCQAIKNGDAQGIYNLLSQQAKVHTSLDDLQRTFNSLNMLSSLGMKFSNCTFNNLHVSGSLAVATISLTIDMTFEGQTMSITSPTLVSMVLENNRWKIDFSDFAQPQPDINMPNLAFPTVSSN